MLSRLECHPYSHATTRLNTPPQCPDGVLAFEGILVACLQGGGVFIQGGVVTFTQTNIYSNIAAYVSVSYLKPSQCPDGVLAF